MTTCPRWPFLLLVLAGGGCAGIAVATADEPQPRFVEKQVIDYRAPFGMGTGVSAADFDGDGDTDLFLPTGDNQPNLLLQNTGEGEFIEVQDDVGLQSTEAVRAALFVDVNGDGQLDLFTARDYWGFSPEEQLPGDGTALRLFEQSDGRYVEITNASGVDSAWISESRAHLGGLCAGDVNNDGAIDLFATVWGGAGNRLYINNRNGTFTEVARRTALESPAHYWQPVMADFNRDGWTDIYSAIDFAPNALWVNQRNLRFRDRGFWSGSDNDMNDMGVALGDYDNDGDFDLFVTNIEREVSHSVLLRNDSKDESLLFAEVSREAGLGGGGWAWGCTFFDADNDGWLDLALTNGWPVREEYGIDQSRLFQNRRGAFHDVSGDAGFSDALWGSSLIAADIDGDGDRDLIQTCIDDDSQSAHLRILENRLDVARRRQTFTVLPRMIRGSNRFAVGAEVEVSLDSGITMRRRISVGGSFLGQEPYGATFGTGGASVEHVNVFWPNGRVSTLGAQLTGAAIRPINRDADSFIAIARENGESMTVTWHGGILEDADATSSTSQFEWNRVPQAENPYRFRSTDSPGGKVFRVNSE